MRKIIHSIKYEEIFAAIPDLANLAISGYHQQFKFDYLVPVPLSKQRQRERGFNQTEKLTKIISKKLGIDMATLLERRLDTKPQFDLSVEERTINVKDAFILSSRLKNKDLYGLTFCLIDDVITTGSTLKECAKVLKQAGAGKIYSLVMSI